MIVCLYSNRKFLILQSQFDGFLQNGTISVQTSETAYWDHRPTFVKKTCDKLLRTEPPRGVGGCPPELSETYDLGEILSEGRKNKVFLAKALREFLTKASAAGAKFFSIYVLLRLFSLRFLTKGK